MTQKFADAIEAGDEIITAWSSIPNNLLVENMLLAGYDAVTLDMQHGYHDTSSVASGISTAALLNKPAIVRIPVGAFDMASRALDFGADAVIAPMVNTVEDAKTFADFMKYPPMGERSWGPARAMRLSGLNTPQNYLASANKRTFAIAMIETRQALDNLDAILSVDGIDGIFVGPSDISVTFSDGAEFNPFGERSMPVIEDIASRTVAAGKLACIFAASPANAQLSRKLGYRFMALSVDYNVIAKGAKDLLTRARDE